MLECNRSSTTFIYAIIPARLRSVQVIAIQYLSFYVSHLQNLIVFNPLHKKSPLHLCTRFTAHPIALFITILAN